jgi:hypothetical protein
MAQRMRVRRSRAAWVGALAVLCGGLSGCFGPEKDKKPWDPPPQAKGSTGRTTTTGVYGPDGRPIQTSTTAPGGVNSPYNNGTTGTMPGSGSITGSPGQYPQGYRPSGPQYDPMAPANPNYPGMINNPVRPTSGAQFNSAPAQSPLAPSVSPAGGSGAYSSPGYGSGAMSPAGGSSYGSPSSSSAYTTGSTTGYRRPDPTPPPMNDLGPLPPSAPPSGLAPSVGPSIPASAPVPSMAAPASPVGSGYGGYPLR